MTSQRCSSDSVSPQEGMGVFPSVSFQKSAPSVSSQRLESDKLPGRTRGPLRSSVAAAGPSPLPAGPWQGRQFIVYRFLPWTIDFSSAANGFDLRAARTGALQPLFVETG